METHDLVWGENGNAIVSYRIVLFYSFIKIITKEIITKVQYD